VITVSEIKEKSLKRYLFVLKSLLNKEEPFPLIIPGNKKGNEDFLKRRNELQKLLQNSDKNKKSSYSLELEEIETRKEGKQTKIKKIYFSNLEKYLDFIDKKKEAEKFFYNYMLFIKTFPQLKEWLMENSNKIIKISDKMEDILKVCLFFNEKSIPYCYIRELPIEVSTKFIEENSSFLIQIIDQLKPNLTEKRESSDFAIHFGLKKANGFLFRIRLPKGKKALGIKEIGIPLNELSNLTIDFEETIIIENRVNYLTCPTAENRLIIWGSGKAVTLLKGWQILKEKKIRYWGDIDAEGFAILNSLRKIFPQTKSVLMDSKTFQKNNQWIQTISTGSPLELQYLTEKEASLYKSLFSSDGKTLRLEQENILHTDIIDAI